MDFSSNLSDGSGLPSLPHRSALRYAIRANLPAKDRPPPQLLKNTISRMNFGLFTVPIAPLILLCSVVVAMVTGWLYSRRRMSVERPIFNGVLAGLAVARISFVLNYLPAYDGNLLAILDFRDQGFDLIPGVIAGGCVSIWYLLRRRSMRGPLVVSLVTGILVWCAASEVAKFSVEPQSVPAVSLFDVSGVREPLARSGGRPTILNLWATWCPPCQTEMPVLAEAQANHPEIDMVFVNQGETQNAVYSYLRSHQLQVDHALLDPGLVVARTASVTGYPTTLFYDSKGRLIAKHVGPFSRATFADAINRYYWGAHRDLAH